MRVHQLERPPARQGRAAGAASTACEVRDPPEKKSGT